MEVTNNSTSSKMIIKIINIRHHMPVKQFDSSDKNDLLPDGFLTAYKLVVRTHREYGIIIIPILVKQTFNIKNMKFSLICKS